MTPEKPIQFNPAMVTALMRDTDPKTQTRRCVGLDSVNASPDIWHKPEWDERRRGFMFWFIGDQTHAEFVKSPFVVGGRAWVREAYYQRGHWETHHHLLTKGGMMKWHFLPDEEFVLFDPPGSQDIRLARNRKDPSTTAWHKRLARFMPRRYSRTMLEITDVRIERLQNISEADAKAEGVEPLDFERDERDETVCPTCGGTRLHGALGHNLGVMEVDCVDCDTHKKRYRHLWDSINGADPAKCWAANPWVWAISFKRIEQ